LASGRTACTALNGTTNFACGVRFAPLTTISTALPGSPPRGAMFATVGGAAFAFAARNSRTTPSAGGHPIPFPGVASRSRSPGALFTRPEEEIRHPAAEVRQNPVAGQFLVFGQDLGELAAPEHRHRSVFGMHHPHQRHPPPLELRDPLEELAPPIVRRE